MKFTVERCIMGIGGVVFRWRLENPPVATQPELSVNRNGVRISGVWPVMGHGDLRMLVKMLHAAEIAYHELSAGRELSLDSFAKLVENKEQKMTKTECLKE